MTDKKILKATNTGELEVGQVKIKCYVLEDGTRVIAQRSTTNALASPDRQTEKSGHWFQRMVKNPGIVPYFSDSLRERLENPILFETPGHKSGKGFEATLLPDLCDAILEAKKQHALKEDNPYFEASVQAEVLMRAFAKLGIVALIDEVTGYAKQIDEYQNLIKKYVAEELQTWLKTFGQDYYQQIYKLKGWDWSRYSIGRKNHPWEVANITNRIVYEKLPQGVLDELKKRNPADEKGNRKHKHFQLLTPSQGYVHLLKHLG